MYYAGSAYVYSGFNDPSFDLTACIDSSCFSIDNENSTYEVKRRDAHIYI